MASEAVDPMGVPADVIDDVDTVPQTEEEIQKAKLRALTLNNMACVYRR